MKYRLRRIGEYPAESSIEATPSAPGIKGVSSRSGVGSPADPPGQDETSNKTLFALPFPMGYGGLPQAQVEAAEIVNDKFGIKDPVHRKYNVLSWVRGYYQDRGENCGEHYQAIKAEQLRLSEILRGGQS
jgi:hypothetical protein